MADPVEGLRRVRMPRGTIPGGIALLAVLAVAPRLGADGLLLVDGSSVEGEIKESATEFEVVTSHGSLWVDKAKVKKRIPSVDQILAQAQEAQKKSRALFDQAKQIDEKELHNTRLREAVKTLEGVRDVLVEAQEVYTSMDHYIRLSQPFKQIIQELRLYRDQFQVGGTSRPKSAAGSGASGTAPVKAVTPAVPATAPATGPAATPDAASGTPAGTTPGGADSLLGTAVVAVAPVPPPETEAVILAREVKAHLAAGSVDEAYAKYQQALREGVDVSACRPDLAKAFYERGMRQSPPARPDLRRAYDLNPSEVSYYESYMQASYERGLESAKAKAWNDGTQEFTEAIRASSELLAKSEKAKYHNLRGMAYQWRAITENQKFGGHAPLQVRSDYRRAKADYELVLKLDPDGPYASQARGNLDHVNRVLSQLK